VAKGGDDLATFFEIITRGHRLVYEPGALVLHKHRRDYLGLSRQAYGYGVGLSAFLMKTVIERPARVFELALKIPVGLWYILNPRSGKNQKKEKNYPQELSNKELRGFASGPFLYLYSRLKTFRLTNSLPQITTPAKSDNAAKPTITNVGALIE
jgi:hypothetical protein